MTITIEQQIGFDGDDKKMINDAEELVFDCGFSVPETNAFGQTFRDYNVECERTAAVEEFYRTNHIHQSYAFVKRMREEYGKLNKVEMSIWECVELLNEFVDDSDPDLDEPQIEHLLQTAEAIRKDYPNEDWLHLTGLIHDLGKVLLHPSFGEVPQWAVVGDTFPVGCAFDESNVHHKFFQGNIDFHNPKYNTKYGVYSEGCGLDNVQMSWGHDDYMYLVAKENKSTLPSAALFIIRYHSFYPLHRFGAYTYLMNDEDKENLKWLNVFNKYDLYSKSKVRIDVEKVKPYYLSLIEKDRPSAIPTFFLKIPNSHSRAFSKGIWSVSRAFGWKSMATRGAPGGYPHPIVPGETLVGWIGSGVMGAAMARRILAAGYSLAVYSRSPAKAADLVAAGARLAASPADAAAGAHVVFTVVGHPSDVRAVVLDPDSGALAAISAGGVLVDHTSSHPALAREIAAAARACNCWSVDAPVSGGDVGAREGNLAIFAGGDAAVIEWLAPLFGILGRATAMGCAGTGQSSKIANQIVVGGSALGLSEGLVFARAAGLDAGLFLQAIRGGAAWSAAMEIWGDRVIEGGLLQDKMGEYMVKDLGMALEDGEDGSCPAVLPGAALCRQLYQMMVANGDGKKMQWLVSVIEMINGR